jgi:hypothetical protein
MATERATEQNNQTPWLVTKRSVRSLTPIISLTALLCWGVDKYLANTFLIKLGAGIPFLGGISISLFWIIPAIFALETTRRYFDDLYVFYPERLLHKAGRISLKYSVPVVSFSHVRAIFVSQSLLGRILNYGTISLGTAGESGSEIDIKGIVNPRQLAHRIDNMRRDLERNKKLVKPSEDSSQAANLS